VSYIAPVVTTTFFSLALIKSKNCGILVGYLGLYWKIVVKGLLSSRHW